MEGLRSRYGNEKADDAMNGKKSKLYGEKLKAVQKFSVR
ncbi:hypothetical protein MNB_SV-10-522 [hydrothermal vent metagenome]|uniref:Uncharacterized protein n=1 Tax=hydrothermal vent metagenome TaxID=652676 RepID=A0A1W1BVE3_9ZZZZ